MNPDGTSRYWRVLAGHDDVVELGRLVGASHEGDPAARERAVGRGQLRRLVQDARDAAALHDQAYVVEAGRAQGHPPRVEQGDVAAADTPEPERAVVVDPSRVVVAAVLVARGHAREAGGEVGEPEPGADRVVGPGGRT